MAARSHVPKFGNWDDDNLPYTTYFENARKEKVGMKMNPNDPEENPEAFMCMKGDLGCNSRSQPVQARSSAIGLKKSKSVDKQYTNGQSNNVPNRNIAYARQNSGRRSHRRSMASESGSETEKSNCNSDPFILHSNHRRSNSSQKKTRPGGSSFSSSTSGHSRRSGKYQFDGDKHHRTSSIPKFGEWDETDPGSGENFTVIFNRVKEEKQAPPSKFQNTVPPQPNNYHQSTPARSPSLASKIWCCLFPRGGD